MEGPSASRVPWPGPSEDDHFLAELLSGRRCDARAEQVNAFDVIAKLLRDIREDRAGPDHDPQVRCLIADDVREPRTRPQHSPQFAQVPGHAAEVEASHPCIQTLKPG